MNTSELVTRLEISPISISFQHILDNSKADSGGERDVNFLRFLIDNRLLTLSEARLKRTGAANPEEYYLDRYKKMHYESDRHFLCRTALQDEFKKLGFETLSGIDVGDMNILRSNCNYDIVTTRMDTLIDIGLTPARNYFRGLTDLRIKNYLLTSYFDEYMDDIIFSVFARTEDSRFIEAVKDYEDGFKTYMPQADQEKEIWRSVPDV